MLFRIIDSLLSVGVETKQRLRDLYLRDDRVWVVMLSMGKDSSCMASLVWDMLRNLEPAQRRKDVHFITSDTRCEVPAMLQYVRKNVRMMRDAAREQGLPIKVHLAEPDMEQRFFYQVLGKGNPPPNEKTRFRWCSDKMKIQPTESLVRDLSSQFTVLDEFDAVMLLGVRTQESATRANSIRKHSLDDDYFAKHATFPRILVYHPIRDWSSDDVWAFLLNYNSGVMPWGVESYELHALYSDASGECPLTQPDGKQAKTCGGSRFGCWTCCYVGSEDKMLGNLIESGDEALRPLYYWKRTLYYMRNDVRFRLPIRRRQQGNLPNDHLITFSFLEPEESEVAYVPGSITIYARKLLLETLLYIQEQSGLELIDDDEVNAIVRCWREESGRSYAVEELRTRPMPRINHLSLLANGEVNQKVSDFDGPLPSKTINVSSEQLLEFYERFNSEYSGVVWIPTSDYKTVIEVEVPHYEEKHSLWW